jgi:hypothetical protein
MTSPNPSVPNSPSKPLYTRLAPRIDKQLLAYTAAATAAGVAFLAAAPSAEAKIVYTPANVALAANASFSLDLNNDGAGDFSFYFYAYGLGKPLGYHADALLIDPLKAGNEVWGAQSSKGGSCAAALPPGVKVGTGAAFQGNQLLVWASEGTAYSGPNTHCKLGALPRGAFLGLKFVVHGQTHFGWAHLTIKGQNAVLNGYAYETVPNQPIRTGKASGPTQVSESVPVTPDSTGASLGVLARGADGLAVWRRPEES